ncbi:hypothetical protein NEF87_001779 [Candidatus Lokiarchaeum ossiferum]|uniref:N-acetyltransferase domain-containing protein n=1 Tax=Candidatus Lokiarchaeum ossiferum TaxID=2951803 RepID=A0ABY6HSP8_9ARCH|nr:hypothetical protein NEF87_001779 [Candidatus Lokiarchaeum sp. B-35]
MYLNSCIYFFYHMIQKTSNDHFQKKSWEKDISLSNLLTLHNTMGNYLYPDYNIEFKDDILDLWFGKGFDLSRDVIRFEDDNGKFVGYVAMSNLSGLFKSHFLFYAILPEYFDTRLPQQVIEAGISLGKSQNIQGLEIETTGTLSAPFDRALEKFGFHPFHYALELHLVDLNPSFLPQLPQGLTYQKSLEPVNLEQYVEVYNAAFRGSFDFQEWTLENSQSLIDSQKKHFDFAIGQVFADGILIGSCNLAYEPGKQFGYISGLAVIPKFQHQKIGSYMLLKAIEHFTEKESKKIILTADVENEKAVGLYTKAGFRIIESLKTKTYMVT